MKFILFVFNQIVVLCIIGFVIAAWPKGGTDPEIGRAFHVCFVTDSTKSLTQDQTDELAATEVRQYLDSHCVTEEKGHSGWRWFDAAHPEKVLANESKYWREVYGAHGEPPCIVIDGRGKPVSKPLPENIPALMQLLQTYGGK